LFYPDNIPGYIAALKRVAAILFFKIGTLTHGAVTNAKRLSDERTLSASNPSSITDQLSGSI
jgi:hypothetical protein